MKTAEQIVRSEWFKDHKAKVTKLSDDVTVIDWYQEGTRSYYVRYVFDGYQLYISGDLGFANFCLTWQGTPESFKNVHFDYFDEKRQCSSKEPFEYSSDQFDEDENDYMSDLINHIDSEQADLYELLFQTIKNEMEQYSHNPSVQQFVMYRAAYEFDYLEHMGLDDDNADTFSKFGREPNLSHLAYLEGLKMIAEQLGQEDAE